MLRWFPWKQLISWLARSRGLVDPIKLLSRLESFAQPLEVKEPLELLRAGMVFHARGLLNSSAIQYNLDWIWPFWVERQYDPRDDAFIPRAFSITHVNLTHRNWTAVGVPDFDALPIVDPRGLVTPFWDGWSLDAWLVDDEGRWLIPSRAKQVEQVLDMGSEGSASGRDGISVVTHSRDTDSRGTGLDLVSRVRVAEADPCPVLQIDVEATSERPGWLAIALRPFNPEGVSFVHRLELDEEGRAWHVGERRVNFGEAVDAHRVSKYQAGDVSAALPPAGPRHGTEQNSIRCRVGMASAAALFRLSPDAPRTVTVTVPLSEDSKASRSRRRAAAARESRRAEACAPSGARDASAWSALLAAVPRLETPDRHIRFLYDAAVRTLVLHSPGDVYPGPYTYKRFWFRDAAFMLHGLLFLGLFDRVERVLDTFSSRQTHAGHFLSQEGEWDSNGEALWILDRYVRLRGVAPRPEWRSAIRKASRWIASKRVARDGSVHSGLMPSGFSAEHLGPNDYYYWDDFWSVGGLRSAADLLDDFGDASEAMKFRLEADDLEQAIEASLAAVRERIGRAALPASPHRRLDAGAIGSLAAGYPLQLWPPDDPRLLDTAQFLMDQCFVAGGFFQDMIHSGINPYLTLHVAQVLQRAGEPRAADLLRTVAGLASPTGQWPEAVHPRTLGGCMGDGQHAWAAAEWVAMLRNAFVREEGDGLVLAAGIPAEWLADGPWTFGPTPTPWGPITVTVSVDESGRRKVSWDGAWRGPEPPIAVAEHQDPRSEDAVVETVGAVP